MTDNTSAHLLDELITRQQASAWAGRELTDHDWERLHECIPHSSIPEAIGDIVSSWT